MEACGTVDELNAALGLARCEALPREVEQTVERVQSELFSLGAELGTPDPARHGLLLLTEAHVAALEKAIDNLEAGLPPLRNFILPAGDRGAVLLHAARAVCRRAERRVVSLAASDGGLEPRGVQYLNRLGEYLFVAARFANHEARAAEVKWQFVSLWLRGFQSKGQRY
jgi:cob(I)alamin adenosyltransferase